MTWKKTSMVAQHNELTLQKGSCRGHCTMVMFVGSEIVIQLGFGTLLLLLQR